MILIENAREINIKIRDKIRVIHSNIGASVEDGEDEGAELLVQVELITGMIEHIESNLNVLSS